MFTLHRLLLTAGMVLLASTGVATAAVTTPVRPVGITASDSAVAAAGAFIEQRPARVDGADADELVVAGQERGAGGTTIVRFDQELHGVPVLGGEVVVALDAKRRVLAADAEVLDGAAPAIGPSITAVQARQIAIAAIAKSSGSGLVANEPSLVIYDAAILGGPGPTRPLLTWDVEVARGDDLRQRVFIDATTGIVVQVMDAIKTVMTRYVCDATNTSTKASCDEAAGYARSEGQVATGIADVDNAYDYSGATYDFYLSLGRRSIDGADMPIRSTVRYCPVGSACPYANAYWDGAQMTYGEGYAAADDVVGHELTHGVTDYTSNLVYWYQSGAINEAISDIMGEFVDLANPGSGPTEDTVGKRWLMGEDLPIGAIRDMENPPAFGDPDKMTSANYHFDFSDNGGVHINSGVANKTAFLIADGGTFNGQTVAGIGLTKSASLWYQTNILLRFASDYRDLAGALEQTCASLVTLQVYGFVSADCAEVAKATAATELRTPAATVPAICTAGTPVDAFHEGFDDGTSAWTIGRTVGAENRWYASTASSPDGAPMTWPTPSSTNARAVDSDSRSDSTMAMTTGVVIPASAFLRLAHWHSFEAGTTITRGYDGGVIEYSADGGSWTDIAGLTAVNGYNGAINANFGNPLAGRAAFIASSNGALATRYDLASLAGRTVKFRFRIATDSGGSGYGWYIGDVRVYACAGAPVISAVSPLSGTTAGGTTITISGTELTGASAVTVGGVAASGVTAVSSTRVTAVTPAHAAGLVGVAVTTPGGTTTAGGAFTYLAPEAPAASTPTVPPAIDSAAPAPAPSPSTTAVVTPPASGTWQINTATDVVRTLLAYTTGTTYAIKAVKGSVTRTGTCRRVGATISCSVKAPNGRWRVTITPKVNGKTGKAIIRTVKT